MTAEVVVMNKLAIAVAADSAVTVSGAEGQKIYQSANKLFALGKHVPIGVMVYGSAEFMGVPWETIVKAYRPVLGNKTFPRVEGYLEDFISFLLHNRNLFPEAAQQRYVFADAASYLTLVASEMREAIQKQFASSVNIPEADIRRAISAFISNRLKEMKDLKPIENLPRRYPAIIKAKYRRQITRAIQTVFAKMPIARNTRGQIESIVGELFYREIPGNVSGLVIMGFGEEDVFPKAFEHILRGIAGNRLWCMPVRTQILTWDNSAAIIPFAQSEMVSTFMEGVDPELASFLMGMFSTLLMGYIDQVADALPAAEQEERDQFKEKVAAVCKDQLSQLEKGFHKYRKEKHVHPIMSMIGALPKDELARVAEALVNLTSFKRRVSAQAETVAEPIDVAVISRGDGFVWVKRKHYFPRELNPLWPRAPGVDINAR